MLQVGDRAPGFSIPNHHGDTVTLESLRGRNVILWFYPKADTPGWTVEGCGFRDHQSEFEQKNTVILGASFDSVEDNRAFAEKFSFPYALLCDTDQELGKAYGAFNPESPGHPRRITYVIDAEGVVAQAHASVSPKTHVAELLAEL